MDDAMELPGPLARVWQSLKRRLWPVFALTALLWLLLPVSHLLPGEWSPLQFAIVPREPSALPGVLAAPFLHDGLSHLLANTVPLLCLGSLVALSGRVLFLKVAAVSALTAGLGAWLLGTADRAHLGASGLIMGLLGFLLARGWVARRLTWALISLVVGVLYLGTVAGMVLPERGVSWSSHFWGLTGGVACAWAMYRRPQQPPAPPALRRPAGAPARPRVRQKPAAPGRRERVP